MSALWTALMAGETKESLATMVCELRDQKQAGEEAVEAARRIVEAIEGRSQIFPSANDYQLVARALLSREMLRSEGKP